MAHADMVHAFLDTNVLLHYPPVAQMDWCTICTAKSVQLVFCMTVIHELDSKKSDPRLSARAQRAIKDIRDACKGQGEIRSGVTATIFNHEVRAADFPDSLSPDSADDRIVHLAKRFADLNPSEVVAVVTGDFGMELRATAGGIAVLPLDPSLRLPNPQDELSKRHKETLAELNAIKNRLPKLVVSLSPSDQPAESPAVFQLENTWAPIDVEGAMRAIKEKHPQQAGINAYHNKMFGRGMMAGLVSQEDWERYDKDLDKFYADYSDHFELKNILGDAKARSVRFDLWLRNDGKGLATDIDVRASFPENVRWIAEQGTEDATHLEEGPEPPNPPDTPEARLLGGLDSRLHAMPGAHAFACPPLTARDDWTPEAAVYKEDDDTFAIDVQLPKLKHGHSVCLGQFLAVFSSWDSVKPFQVEYTITTAELLEKVAGQIAFIAHVRESRPESAPTEATQEPPEPGT